MKKNLAPLLIGIALILAGIGYVGNIFFNWDFSIFFDGWWTLFLIVPALIHMIARGIHTGNSILLVLGTAFLLREQNVIPERYMDNVLIAAGIIMLGIGLIVHFISPSKPQPNQYAQTQNNYSQPYSNQQNNKNTDYSYNPNHSNSKKDYNNTTASGFAATATANSSTDKTDYNSSQPNDSEKKNYNVYTDSQPVYNALLSGINEKNNSTDLLGAKISAILGGVDLDLRDAIVKQDITIKVSAVMGGVTIYAPQNVRISLKRSDALGATTCAAKSMPQDSNVPLVTFDCCAFMGGIEIK
ncbi:MAG: LiaF-related protein [Oscillospiraceae bacterium]